MAKVIRQPVMSPEYKYILELSEDEAHQLIALLGGCVDGTLEGIFNGLDILIPRNERKYKLVRGSEPPSLVSK